MQERAISKSNFYMLLVGVFISMFVALYILRLIIRIWSRSQREKREREQAAILNNVSGLPRNDGHGDRGMLNNKGMTQGQFYKFAFLIGLFLTNAGRCLVLIYDWCSHSLFHKTEDQVRTSTAALTFTDLPTLFLMTSFSLFIYYIAQLTIQLELSKLGLFGKL